MVPSFFFWGEFTMGVPVQIDLDLPRDATEVMAFSDWTIYYSRTEGRLYLSPLHQYRGKLALSEDDLLDLWRILKDQMSELRN